jgi:hypothetical protein
MNKKLQARGILKLSVPAGFPDGHRGCSNPVSAGRCPHRNWFKEFIMQSDKAAPQATITLKQMRLKSIVWKDWL